MTKKNGINYPKNFETFVINKLIEHDDKFGNVGKEFDRIHQILSDHSLQLLRLTEKVDRIDERTAFIPKMYDAVDAFMKEIKESREDRVLLSGRVKDHEARLQIVEEALLATPEEKAF